MSTHCDLQTKRCQPCEGGVPPLSAGEAQTLLGQLPGWVIHEEALEKTYTFSDHYQTMAFVNALAWISHREDHHPELVVGYRDCQVRYWTHAIGGLSQNDFICAAKVDALLST